MRSLYSRMNGTRLCLLAPQPELVPKRFANVLEDSEAYGRLLRAVQRLRGRVYVRDGALPAGALTPDGRHDVEADYRSWHVVMRGSDGEVLGAVRLALYPTRDGSPALDGLHAFQVIERMSPPFSRRFSLGLRAFIADALPSVPYFIEAGGWVMNDDPRARVAGHVATGCVWALTRNIGGARGVGTATTRHQSAQILRRSGGFPLSSLDGVLPPFFDPYYDCDMELLGFSSAIVGDGLEPTVTDIQRSLDHVPVFTPELATTAQRLDGVTGTEGRPATD